MNPSQVLDMQADLALRMRDMRFRALAEQTFTLDAGAELTQSAREHRQIRDNSVYLAAHLSQAVTIAHAYRVTPDMSALVQHAATELDETDLFDDRLAPTEAGIVRFDRPIPIIDVRGGTMKGHWLVWGPMPLRDRLGRTQKHTLMTWFNDSFDPDAYEDEVDEDARGFLGRWRWCGADVAGRGRPLGAIRLRMAEQYAEMIRAEGDEPSDTSNTLRYVHALWLLLGQTITTVSPETPDRASARRAKHAKLPGRISVIQLRNADNAHRLEGESLVEWRHRWLVRRHWRWQPYGPRLGVEHKHVYGVSEPGVGTLVQRCVVSGCENYLARIIIEGHVKGPAEAPLVVTDKVYDLSR